MARTAPERTLLDESGATVCARCELALSFLSRLRGLLGRKGLAPDQGLWIPRTSSVHTFFMAFPIDVVFLDRELRVRSITPSLQPQRIAGRAGRGSVLELPAGAVARIGLGVGSRLSWAESGQASPPEDGSMRS